MNNGQDIVTTAPMPEPHIAFVLKHLVNSLIFLHSSNRIHRDIKSDNVLLNTKGEAKLADFGYCVQLTAEVRC